MFKAPIKSVLLVSRLGCKQAQDNVSNILERIKSIRGDTTVALQTWNKRGKPDLVITFGGDGTLLKAASLFPGPSPIFLPISGGTLGFMLPIKEMHDAEHIIDSILKEESSIPILERTRLDVNITDIVGVKAKKFTALNEVNIHRGSAPHLARIECSVDGTQLTSAIADGLLVSTPTGSTAYSLSAGGPILHPSVEGICVTPICPRSLSFRPVILPTNSKISVGISTLSRSTLQVSVDGLNPITIGTGGSITVTKSRYPLKVICGEDPTKDWVKSINGLLGWNLGFNEKVIIDS